MASKKTSQQKKKAVSTTVSETTNSEEEKQLAVNVKEYIKLIRSELKDGKKLNKIEGIVQYSIQEALKENKKEKGVAETFRSE